MFNILLQILEDGHLSDAKGRRVDFRNSIIIMTSNLGAKQLQTNSTLGFRVQGDTDETRAAGLLRADARQGPAGAQAELPAGVPQPDRRHGRLPQPDRRGDHQDRRSHARPGARPAPRPADDARGHRGGQGAHHQARLRRGLRGAAAAPGDPEHGRGRPRRAAPPRAPTSRARRSSSTRARKRASRSTRPTRRPPSKPTRAGGADGEEPQPLRLPGLRRRLPALGGPVPHLRRLEHPRRDGRP